MKPSSPKQSVRKKGWGGRRYGAGGPGKARQRNTPGKKRGMNVRFDSVEQAQQVRKAAKAVGESISQYIVRATLVRMAKDEIRSDAESGSDYGGPISGGSRPIALTEQKRA